MVSYYIYAWYSARQEWYPVVSVIPNFDSLYGHSFVTDIQDINLAHQRAGILRSLLPSYHFAILQGNWSGHSVLSPQDSP